MNKLAMWFFATLAVVGVVCSFWNIGHLWFTAAPSLLMWLAARSDLRREEREKRAAAFNRNFNHHKNN